MRRAVQLLAVLCVVCVAATMAVAGKPPGGDTGGGTIYYGVSATGYDWQLCNMRSDGSGKTALPVFPQGWGVGLAPDASHNLYGGQRWFAVPQNQHQILVVSESGDAQEVLNDPTLVLSQCQVVRWAPNDSAISWAGYRLADDLVTVVEGGLYWLQVNWLTGSPVPAGPPALLIEGEWWEAGLVNVRDHDWSPDGSQIVYADGSACSLRLLDVATGISTDLGAGGWDCAWSPDGTALAFITGSGLETLVLSTGVRRLIVPTTSSGKGTHSPTMPSWSPGSTHLAYRDVLNKAGPSGPWSADICRVSAGGGTKTNLTGDTSLQVLAIAWR